MAHSSSYYKHTVHLKILQCRSERQMHVMTLARPPSQDAVEAQIKVVIVTITAIWLHSANITAKLLS